MLVAATMRDVDTLVGLERQFFKERAEIREAYELVLEFGRALLEYKEGKEGPNGMLATMPVNDIMKNKNRFMALPTASPFRERVSKGYLNGYGGYQFIVAFVSSGRSEALTAEFLDIDRAVGFCYETAAKSLAFYELVGCERKGTVPNIHGHGQDVVLTYKKRL